MRHPAVIILLLLSLESCTVLKYQHDAISSYFGNVKMEAAAKKEARRKEKDRLASAMESGRVVKGMTKSQVKAVRGKPDYASTDKLMGMWRYVTVWTYLNTLDCVIFLDGKMDEVQNMADIDPQKIKRRW